MKKIISTKKGQVWTLDYLIGLFLFIIVLFSVIFIMKGYLSEKDTFKETARESDHIASILLSGQIPYTGDSNISALIISENNRINISKLQTFDSLSYSQKKIMFQNSGEFVFYFYNGSIINETVCFRGYIFPTDNCTLQIPSSAENIAKTERIVILNSEIVKLIVIAWT
jgi:hypothetical protein